MRSQELDLEVDVNEGAVSLSLPKSQYSLEALRIAAHIFDRRAEVLLGDEKLCYEVTLQSKRRGVDAAALQALGGEFLNELLNQEYRFVVGRFNHKISSLIVAQALLAARGGEETPAPPAEEQTPEFKAEVEKLLAEAAEEIKRTMPRKLPPQGTVLPPAEESVG